MSKKEQRPEASQANRRMEKGTRSTKGCWWRQPLRPCCQEKTEAHRREESPEEPEGEDQTWARDREEGDSSGELCMHCLSRTKGLCSLGMMNWHCSRILERVEGCSTCKLICVHNFIFQNSWVLVLCYSNISAVSSLDTASHLSWHNSNPYIVPVFSTSSQELYFQLC